MSESVTGADLQHAMSRLVGELGAVEGRLRDQMRSAERRHDEQLAAMERRFSARGFRFALDMIGLEIRLGGEIWKATWRITNAVGEEVRKLIPAIKETHLEHVRRRAHTIEPGHRPRRR